MAYGAGIISFFTNATSLGLNNKFVGLDNYIYMFHDKSFIQALINTAKLMAVVPVITIFCSLVLAFVLNQCKLKEMVLYRTIFYFPNIVSLTVVGIIWSFVFHPNVGIVNKILGAVGLESLQRSWLGDSKTALWCIAFTLLWQAAGYYMVMHIAAMDGISPEIYESATLDGASAWRKLVKHYNASDERYYRHHLCSGTFRHHQPEFCAFAGHDWRRS